MNSHSAMPARVASVPHDELRRGERPLSPDDDPFYRAPQGYKDAEPGTVLRSRDVEIGFLGLIRQQVRAVQLLYRTTNLHEEPEVAVTTVLVPARRDSDAAYPVLSYQCAIDAVASRCFPSFAMRRGARPIGAFVQAEYLLVTAALAEGWAVCVPDHEGCHGMWGAPVEPGYRILDGLRAAMQCERLDLSPSAPVGLWGYSGGGLASAWAAELCERYAPELNIVGAVLGSPVGDPGSVARRLNGSFFAGLAALMISALTHVFPGAQKVVDEHATDEGKAVLDELQTMTTAQAVWRFRNVDIGSYVDMTADELWDLPEVRHIFHETKLGKSRPKPPVLVIQAVHDGIISVDDVDALVAEYERVGAAVTYHRDRFCGHLLLHPLSAPMALRWLRDRFTDRPVNEHKTRTVWPTLFNPSTYLGMVKLGVITAKVVLGRSVGRQPLSTTDAR
ncbi:lipase [Mycobacterium intermedium]|uniref:Lipase n=1 Tax=Mycobacterium intermedium TaxID=28445 RepID=A0A1E3SD45_MYCIE|nr:lipase family protein [Mycobacterium intermedium]MCV6964135.1 lipase [Mycobacterium intermedium]ODR00050.1 lipase [Mycobacterium intermedium]OPE48310.1 lipase [Mycobacterium intermedium]ORA96918.1 lipase [Mycobacterium intermedium]